MPPHSDGPPHPTSNWLLALGVTMALEGLEKNFRFPIFCLPQEASFAHYSSFGY